MKERGWKGRWLSLCEVSQSLQGMKLPHLMEKWALLKSQALGKAVSYKTYFLVKLLEIVIYTS